MNLNNGLFIISLDLELRWGVLDTKSLVSYRERLLRGREMIPRLLELFEQYGIHATWGTVGYLFFDSYDELVEHLPERRPKYDNSELSTYRLIEETEELDRNEVEDRLHYGAELIEKIVTTEGQKIGCHTFSHYYCDEAGQTAEDFRADLKAAKEAATRKDIELESLILPRNQVRRPHLQVAEELGFKCYRGSKPGWIYQPVSEPASPPRRLARMLEDWLGLFSPYTYECPEKKEQEPVNLRASQFLRPPPRLPGATSSVRKKLAEQLKRAAEKREIFHLWWHPHNFGRQPERYLQFLEKILVEYEKLNKTHGLRSVSMEEAVSGR